jgi:hypothetical protein
MNESTDTNTTQPCYNHATTIIHQKRTNKPTDKTTINENNGTTRQRYNSDKTQQPTKKATRRKMKNMKNMKKHKAIHRNI